MELSSYRELFLAESREHISAINHNLLALEADPAARTPIESVFRAVHTVKGMAATMGYRAVAELAHEIETLLEVLRQGTILPDPELLNLCFAGADGLERAIELAVAEREAEFDAGPLIERLRTVVMEVESSAQSPSVNGGTDPGVPVIGDRISTAGGGSDAAETGPYRVRVAVRKDSSLSGARAMLALRRARELGRVDDVDPAEESLSADDFAGALRFVLHTALQARDVEQSLRAVGEIERVAVRRETRARPATSGGNGASAVGGSREAEWVHGRAPGGGRHVRVELDRLDSLLNQLGELVILRDHLQQVAARHELSDLSDPLEQAIRQINELQHQVMRVRMVPVWQVFDRFPRLVRDAAQELGKRVEFVMEGRDIEFDRSMLDELVDAVVHLLRNAVDHGIEPPGERRHRGKSEIGTLHLHAYRERDHAVIRVEDDGRGIDRDRIREAAVARGLIAQDAAEALDDAETLSLITRSGFSTAERVTDVSGRGVGLDVVANRVRSLGGALEIDSDTDSGTCFTLRLPLTLAIVRALLVRVHEDVYALPLVHVSETAEFRAEQLNAVGSQSYARLRGELIPVIRLRTLLRYDRPSQQAEHVPVVLLEVGDQVIGLEVDALLGQREVVVKTFDSTTGTLRLFSGATILSGGRPALILDAASLFVQAEPRVTTEAA